MLYVNLRRTDKTTKALRIASAMGVPLLVADSSRAVCAERMSRELNLPVIIYRADDIRQNRFRGEHWPVVIDDVDAVLRTLFGVNVLLATSTGEEAQLDLEEMSKPNR